MKKAVRCGGVIVLFTVCIALIVRLSLRFDSLWPCLLIAIPVYEARDLIRMWRFEHAIKNSMEAEREETFS